MTTQKNKIIFNPFTKNFDFINKIIEADLRDGTNKWNIFWKGTQIGEIDINGNLSIKGSLKTKQTLGTYGIKAEFGFIYTSTGLDVFWGTKKLAEWNGTTGNLSIRGSLKTKQTLAFNIQHYDILYNQTKLIQWNNNGDLLLEGSLKTKVSF